MRMFLSRFESRIEGGYSKVKVNESTTSGYPAVHMIVKLAKPIKVKHHRKSGTYRPDPSDPYTRRFLSAFKDLNNWNAPCPIWGLGFADVYAFTKDCITMKGHSNPLKYISKYITKSLDLSAIPDLHSYTKVSQLPKKFRTAVWTILNSLIWNYQTWVISKAFREDLKKLQEAKHPKDGSWIWIATVGSDNPLLVNWMSDNVEDLPKESYPRIKPPSRSRHIPIKQL